MFLGLRTVIYPVPDLAASTAWFTEVLGYPPYFDEPFYVGFAVGGYEFGLLPQDRDAPAREAIAYWGVTDADAAVSRLVAAGASPTDPVTDVGDGIRTASVTGPGGTVVGVIENPHFELAETISILPGPGR